MKYNLSEFEKRVESGLIRKVETDKLVLYNYTDKCTYDRAWDEYTLAARGIIFEKETGKLIAKPFPKFFNLGEMPETQLLNLPNEPYDVTQKMDGSLGIIYFYDDEWHVATRGSFTSEQAVKAQEMLLDSEYIDELVPGITYLVEIIYPGNKIVVNYGQEEKLVCLAVYNGDSELERSTFPKGMEKAAAFAYPIEEMIALQKILPKDEEGFVVRFQSGLRVKIKGHEYLKIHKMISNMSPLSFWESMENGVVNKEYLSQLPEEFRNEFEPMVEQLEYSYKQTLEEIKWEADKLPMGARAIGMLIQAAGHGLKHPGAMFPFILDKKEALNKYIMKYIRPDGNVLKS